MSLAEVAEVVTRLLSDKMPAVDESHHEIVKALDIVGLFWLTYLFSVAWRTETVPVEWQKMEIALQLQG